MFGSAQDSPMLNVKIRVKESVSARMEYLPPLQAIIDCIKDVLENAHKTMLNSGTLVELIQLLQPITLGNSAGNGPSQGVISLCKPPSFP